MKKLIVLVLMFAFMVPFFQFNTAEAANNNSIDISILSPQKVKNYPGFETNIVTKITNNTKHELKDAMTYITMADLGKHWTVNLEDYSADKPIKIGTLLPGESKKVTLPIRFVYTSQYKLYVTVSSDLDSNIYSSQAIPVDILGNTKIDPTLVIIISTIEPIIILVLIGFTLLRKKASNNAV